MSHELPKFRILASNKVVGFPDGNIISWCPQKDLLAISMNQTSIWVFRLEGERVYSINNRAKILHLRWNSNGRFFALSGTDNAIKVYDSNNGNLVNKFATNAELAITLVSWTSIDIAKSIDSSEEPQEFQNLFEVEILKNMPQLANEIDSSDHARVVNQVETPYTSHSVTSTADDDSKMDYLIVLSAESLMSITFNNLFTISGIKLPTEYMFLKHAMTDNFFSQDFLVSDSKSNLYLQELVIAVSKAKDRNCLFKTIRWAAQLVSITNHINDQFFEMQSQAKEFISLHDRYLSNFKECLYAHSDRISNLPARNEVEDKIVEDLGNIVLTGLINSSMKDYWLNQFGERGLMRISSVANTAFDNIRKILFTQLVLASEKIIIILSYLESTALAAKYTKCEPYGIVVETVQKAIEHTQLLVKKIYDFIWKLNEDHELFNQYLNWVKVEILEKLSKEDSDPESFFAEHMTMNFKASSIVKFVDEHLLDPVLLSTLDVDTEENEILVRRPSSDCSLRGYIDNIQSEIKNMLSGIEEYLKSKVHFNNPVRLGSLVPAAQMEFELFSADKVIALRSAKQLSVIMITGKQQLKLDINYPGEVLSHKIINETTMLVLYSGENGEYFLDMIKIVAIHASIDYTQSDVVKRLNFNSATFVKKPSYMTINSRHNPAHIIGLILDESKKMLMVFEI